MLVVEGVVVRFGALEALAGVDLTLPPGERLSVLGPSGSGKSTLLRAIAGLEPPTAGRLSWDGRDLAGVPAHARGFGLMFQDYVLFPHRDVAGNVAFGLRMRGEPPAGQRRRVAEVLAMVGLGGYERREVSRLSGGEQQRVALARALATEPRLLMLDEPLGALDRDLRQRLVADLGRLFAELSLTIVYVTHDQEEALSMGDRVAVMRAGRIEALLPPGELWRAPPSEFVARFLGFNNLVEPEELPDGRLQTPWGTFPSAPVGPGADPGASLVLVRPEGVQLSAEGPLRGKIVARTFRGERVLLRVELPAAPALEVLADWLDAPAVGQQVSLVIEPSAVQLVPVRAAPPSAR
ncbi:MAG TPA: ABC transporter ATP-binding protein [Candidatus Limnocylindria bacterium]|nr:ABC transporter ATP-binding protein [Candidatus Limnocylindria bacterium]